MNVWRLVKKFFEIYIRWFYELNKSKKMMLFFFVVLGLLALRLFFLQVVQGSAYAETFINQHFSRSTLKAERWHIYMVDRTGKKIQLTQNIELFTLHIDPKFVEDKPRILNFLTPLVYDHLCVHFGVELVERYTCMRNVEKFTGQELLPKEQLVHYLSGDFLANDQGVAIWWDGTDQQVFVDPEIYNAELQSAMETFTAEYGRQLIREKLDTMIVRGIKPRNYLWFFDNPQLLEDLLAKEWPFIEIFNQYYVYIRPDAVAHLPTALQDTAALFQSHGFGFTVTGLRKLFTPQENRYVRITTNMNAKLAKIVRDAQRTFARELINGVPVYHGLGLESYEIRYYPYWNFASHVLGYMTRDGRAHYGVEEYYNKELAGKDGEIIWLATPWIGQVGSNSVDIKEPQAWKDVYLTVDPHIQREVERILASYYNRFLPDVMSMTVIETDSGKIRAMAWYPSFNPNFYQDAYKIRPLTFDDKYIAENISYIDRPIFIEEIGSQDIRLARSDERDDATRKRYIFTNWLGPQIFINNAISRPYEPGSIFKPLTAAIAVDSDSVRMSDTYIDPGFVMIGQFRISNISSECPGEHTYSHAIAFSCNVGMVRMAQQMTKYPFYNYLLRLWFGALTNIQLAGEEAGAVPDSNTVSTAWFFNNTYGQGLLATPIQLATAFAAAVNGGTYRKPSIVESIYDKKFSTMSPVEIAMNYQVFRPSSSQAIREVLAYTIKYGQMKPLSSVGYDLWGKTWTAEIAFKGKYRGDLWRTNVSLVGLVNQHNPKYIVVIQVKRPRTSKFWMDVNGDIFKETAQFLLAYDNYVPSTE
jgi:cell division protein FtsI/penicillin-binding protein 2